MRYFFCCFAGAVASIAVATIFSGMAQAQVPELVTDTLPAKLPLDQIPEGLDSALPVPDDNELTESRVQLGRRLFFDPQLSGDKTVACASCHRPDQAFSINEPLSVGVSGAKGRRNVPSLFNRAYGKKMFWDSRTDSLESQALLPITNETELANTVPVVIERLKQDPTYVKQFAEAYEGEINEANLAKAIASFERVLLSGNSGVDRFRASQYEALSTGARQGMWIFESSGGCWKCHSGKNFSDEEAHNTGVSWGQEPIDLGLFELTQKEEDRGKFKTPTLRDVALTAPYMHDGSIETLREVVEYYNRGGNRNELIDPDLKPLNLTEKQLDHLVEFLESLTGEAPWQSANSDNEDSKTE